MGRMVVSRRRALLLSLIAAVATPVGGCATMLDDDFEIVPAEAGADPPSADGAAALPADLAPRSTEDAGAPGCQCKPGSVCVAGECACAAATPKDCGAECRQCCSDSDCEDGDPCTKNVCSPNGQCAAPAGCGADQLCCPGVGCAQCCTDADCPTDKTCETNRCKGEL